MSLSSEMAADGPLIRSPEPAQGRRTPVSDTFSLSRWIGPAVLVRLLDAPQAPSLWQVDVAGRIRPSASKRPAPFTALRVPNEWVLWKQVDVPPIPAEQLESALALQVQALSPFASDDTVWAHASAQVAGGLRCHVAIASRRQLQAWRDSVPDAAEAELWAIPDGVATAPVVMRGFGEARRRQTLRLRGALQWVAAGILMVLLLAGLLSPSAQLYQRATQAAVEHTQVREQARPALAAREAYQHTTQRWQALHEQLGGTLDAVRVMQELTRLLPDDAHLARLQVEGHKVTLSGQAANAASLLDQLGAAPGFAAVRAPSPATRVGNTGQERFVIEAQLDPNVFALSARAAVRPAAEAAPAEPSQERP